MKVEIPRGWEWVGVPVAAIGTLLSLIPVVFLGLLIMQGLDIVSGLASAVSQGTPVSSKTMAQGLTIKALSWCLIFGLATLGWIVPDQFATYGLMPATGLAGAFAVHEFISIGENYLDAGGWAPDQFKVVFGRGAKTASVIEFHG